MKVSHSPDAINFNNSDGSSPALAGLLNIRSGAGQTQAGPYMRALLMTRAMTHDPKQVLLTHAVQNIDAAQKFCRQAPDRSSVGVLCDELHAVADEVVAGVENGSVNSVEAVREKIGCQLCQMCRHLSTELVDDQAKAFMH